MLARTLLAAAFLSLASPALAQSDVYVTDAFNQRVFAYPAGVAEPAPAASVVTPGIPGGIATDPAGDVYVAVNEGTPLSAIVEYAPGLRSIVTELSGPQLGFSSFRDVAIDERGNLYVSCVSAGGPGVVELSSAHTIVGWYGAPTSQIYGLLVNPAGGFFVDTGLYGEILGYTTSAAYTVDGINGAPSPGGLAFVGADIVMTGGDGLFIFTPSDTAYPYVRTDVVDFGSGHGTGYPATGPDGTFYVPVRGQSGGKSLVHEVRAYPPSAAIARIAFAAYYTISRGLQEPMGVAVGPVNVARGARRSGR